MQAEIFYLSEAEKSVALAVITPKQLEDNNGLPAAERSFLNNCQFKANLGEVALFIGADSTISKVFVGAGEATDEQAVAFAMPRLPIGAYSAPELSRSAQLVWALSQYKFDKYKKQDTAIRHLILPAKALDDIVLDAKAIFLVRDLINTPTNDMTPKELGQTVQVLAKEYGAEFEQWVGEELLSNNFPAIHTVGRASSASPRLISLCWGDKNHPKVTLVGKGVCFDSGGLDIKPSSGMRLMKKDMAGAAHVIGLAKWLMEKKLPIRLTVLIPAVENSISSNAYRPGDILTMRNGMTVEIENTDAEGRLILADAISKACEEKPEVLIDFSTLTGAARVAMGTEISAILSNNDQLANEVTTASMEVNDPVWRLPLYKGYETQLDSTVADISNCGSTPYGGAITAGLFLQRFVEGNIPWIHFDIMAWNIGNKPGKPEGGEAMGIMAMGHYLSHRYG